MSGSRKRREGWQIGTRGRDEGKSEEGKTVFIFVSVCV